MKIKNSYFAAALMTFAGCTSDDNSGAEMLPEGKYPLEIEATGLTATRSTRATVDGNWDGVEKVAVMVGDEMKEYTVSTDGETTGANAKLSSATDPFYWTSKADIKVSAWWPYTEGSTTMPEVKVKADQSGDGYKESDFIEANEPTVTRTDNELLFTHRTAKIQVTLSASTGTAFTADQLSKAAVTLCIADGTNPEAITTYNVGGGKWYALIAPTSLVGEKLTIKISIPVGDGTSKNYVYKHNFAEEYSFAANSLYTFNLTVGKEEVKLSGCKIAEWETGDSFGGEAEEEKDYEVIGEVYHVYTAIGLEAWRLATTETDGSTTDCVLENDIVMPDVAEGESNWTKVGDGFNPYKGIFDGNGHTIRNLVIKGGESGGSQGFFGVLYGGTVKNLTLEDPDVTSSFSGVGALVGYMTGSTIEYCQVIGGFVESSYSNNEIKFTHVGGLVGNIVSGSTITACSASCEVSCPSNGILGGLVGSVSSSTFTLTSCWYPP